MSQVSICIVGLGEHGTLQLRQFLRSPDRWAIAGVVDTSIAAYMRLRSIYPEMQVPYFRQLSEALDALEPDVTLISTHAPSHVAIAKEVIGRGFSRSVLIEKPVSNSVAVADSLIEFIRCRQWPGRVAVDFGRRCSDFYNRVRNIISSAELGALVGIEYVRPCKLSMKAGHYIDLANWFMNSPAVSVTARLEEDSYVDKRGAFFFDPGGFVEVTYANGVVLRMDTREGTKEPFGMTIRLERGSLFVDHAELFLTVETAAGSKRIPGDRYNHGYNWMENTVSALVRGDDSFVPCSLEDAVDSLAILVAAHVSHRNGGHIVRLPLNEADKATALRIA